MKPTTDASAPPPAPGEGVAARPEPRAGVDARAARPRPALPVASDAEVAVDAAVIAAGSLAIAFGAQRLALMTALVPALVLLRIALWWLAARRRGASLAAELLFLGLCTGLGAFNDWNSVVRHGVYAYTVPVYFPERSTIPLWMLLYWGLILRFMAAIASWGRLGAGPAPRDAVRLGLRLAHRPLLRVALLLAFVLATRQTIYRFALDPIWSWLPFAAALGLYPLLFGLDRHELRIAAITLAAGPLVEILYIQVAHLHVYPLGWFGGVPLRIALWWVLAVLCWKDVGRRIQGRLESWLQSD